MRVVVALALVVFLAGCAPVRAAPSLGFAVPASPCDPAPDLVAVAAAAAPCPRLPAVVHGPNPCRSVRPCDGGDLGGLGSLPCTGDPPRHLRAEVRQDGVRLTWEHPSAGAPQRYRVYRVLTLEERGPAFAVAASATPIADLEGDLTSFVDHGSDAREDATYWVTAVGACESRPSNSASSGTLPPNVFECVYPDVETEPSPHVQDIYVGLDCLDLPGSVPMPPYSLDLFEGVP